MGKEPEFFHNKWGATRLCFEPTTVQRTFTMGFTTKGDGNWKCRF